MNFEIKELKEESGKYVIYDRFYGRFLEWRDANIDMNGSIRTDTKEEANTIMKWINAEIYYNDMLMGIKNHLSTNLRVGG